MKSYYNREQQREYEKKNADKIAKRKALYYLKKQGMILARSKKYYNENKEKVLARTKKNKNERIKRDPMFKMSSQLRTRLYKVLQSKKWFKNNTFAKYIGCSLDELKFHLQKQFKPDMSWENHGKWHIDHIVPLSSAKDIEELFKLCHYTNLQPLWAKENQSKQDKIII